MKDKHVEITLAKEWENDATPSTWQVLPHEIILLILLDFKGVF
jgi:hypothetical protein